MTTLDTLVSEVQSRALSGMREEISVLAAAMDAVTGVVTLPAGVPRNSIQPGATLQIDYELIGVVAVLTPTSVSGVRGLYNSNPAPHAAGAQIIVNPHFSAMDIIAAINQDIDDLSAPTNGLYQMNVITIVYNPAITGYDLVGLTNSQVLELWELRTWDFGSQLAWPLLPPTKWKLERNASPTIFPSTMSVKIYSGAYPGRPIRIQYKAPFTTPLVNPTDDVHTVTGLHPQAHDIPVLGATMRLMQFRELKRSFSEAQGEPRRAQEVPVGSSLTAVKGIQAQRMERIASERERLNKIYVRAHR